MRQRRGGLQVGDGDPVFGELVVGVAVRVAEPVFGGDRGPAGSVGEPGAPPTEGRVGDHVMFRAGHQPEVGDAGSMARLAGEEPARVVTEVCFDPVDVVGEDDDRAVFGEEFERQCVISRRALVKLFAVLGAGDVIAAADMDCDRVLGIEGLAEPLAFGVGGDGGGEF